MNWIFDNDRPIYIQLVEQLKIFIVTGAYKCGEKLPSVRELAFETKVNPNTMQKALLELESYGVIYTQRTSGKFVTEDKNLINKLRDEIAKEKLNEFLNVMKRLGYSKEQIVKYLKENGGDVN